MSDLSCFECMLVTPPPQEASNAAEDARKVRALRRSEGLTILNGTLLCRFHATDPVVPLYRQPR